MKNRIEVPLTELAALVGGGIRGEADLMFSGVAPLETADPDQIGFLVDRRYRRYLEDTQAIAVLTSEEFGDPVIEAGKTALVVEHPHQALAVILKRLHPKEESDPEIHPTAVIGRGVELGEGVAIGPYAVLDDGARIGPRTRIGSHVCVGKHAVIGADSLLHPHVVVYPDVQIGARVTLHAGARVGVDGFGYVLVEGRLEQVPQVGDCIVGDDVDLGANSCIDRGSIGRTVVEPGAKLDNLVHLGHNVTVGSMAMLAAQVGVAGSSSVGKGVVCGGQAGIAGHLSVGDGARLAAQAGVIGDIPPGETVSGYPARPHLEVLRGTANTRRIPDLVRRLEELEKRLGEKTFMKEDR